MGLCLYHLGMMLMNMRGKEATLQFLEAVGFKGNVSWDVARQVTIAKEIVARYVD